MADFERILSDLDDELWSLDEIVQHLRGNDWDAPTPAEPWTVRDQIAHLAFFDDQAVLALMNPEAFSNSLAQIAADVGAFMEQSITKGRAMTGEGVLGWWRESRTAVLDALRKVDPSGRVPWYGPPMRPASFASARIMETWAHGQDVVDGLGVDRDPTDRLRHVAHIGVRARSYSYVTNDLEPPDNEVFVELESPGGATWTWGEPRDERVIGPAVDFCLVVTQRRNVADTLLVVEGHSATEWMGIAQAYAGPPGEGRRPGQFAGR